jgi:hypothetical protein
VLCCVVLCCVVLCCVVLCCVVLCCVVFCVVRCVVLRVVLCCCVVLVCCVLFYLCRCLCLTLPEERPPAGCSHRSLESSRSMGMLNEVRWTDKTLPSDATKKKQRNRRHFGYQEPTVASCLSHRDDE